MAWKAFVGMESVTFMNMFMTEHDSCHFCAQPDKQKKKKRIFLANYLTVLWIVAFHS